MKITIKNFGGIAPEISPHELANNMAQEAENARLLGGELQAWDNATLAATLVNTSVVKTIYFYAGEYWLEWTADVDVIPGPISGDTTNRLYFTGTDAPRVTNATLATSGTGAMPRSSYLLGVPAPTAALTVGTPGSGGVGDERYSAYVYTFVTALGEESAPSPVSDRVLCKSGQTIPLSDIEAVPAGDYNITNVRIYRALVGEETVDYRFVAEIASGVATYDDSVEDLDLGEANGTEGYAPPPASLKGLISLPNGVIAGFTGKDLYFCEPYKPHAWPTAYNITLPYTIVAIGFVGQTVVVTTDKFPYILAGTDPSAYSVTKLPHRAPCVSKKSLVFGDFGVAWATPDGLFLYDGSDGRLVTRGIIDRYSRWANFAPASIRATVYNGKYFGWYETGAVDGYPVGGGFVIDLLANPIQVATFDTFWPAAYVEPSTDTLYYVDKIAGVNYVYKFEGTALNKRGTYTWVSKEFFTPQALSFAWGRVTADWKDLDDYWAYVTARNAIIAENVVRMASGNIGGEIGAADVGGTDVNGDNLLDVPPEISYTGDFELAFSVLDENGAVNETRAVYSNKPFRLSGGFRSRQHTIKLVGNVDVKQVDIATSSADLVGG